MRARLFFVPALVVTMPASAQTRTDFTISARIVAGCLIAVDAGGALGTIDLGSVPGTQTGPVEADLLSGSGTGLSIECTPGTTVSLVADTGLHAVTGSRNLASGSNLIPYRLLVGSGLTRWDAQSVALTFPAGSGAQRLGIRGQATLSGEKAAGAYVDTVHITLTW